MNLRRFERKVDFIKVDEEERKVWGIFSVAKIGDKYVVDGQDDIIDPIDLEKAAHDFVLRVNTPDNEGMGDSHKTTRVGKMIESIVFTKEKSEMLESALKSIGAEATISPGADIWFGGFYVEKDDVWDKIKSGAFESFSIGGKAVATEIE